MVEPLVYVEDESIDENMYCTMSLIEEANLSTAYMVIHTCEETCGLIL